MGSLKSPCTTSYKSWSSMDTIALNCLVFEKNAFFCILATDRQTDRQTDKQMDIIDAWSRRSREAAVASCGLNIRPEWRPTRSVQAAISTRWRQTNRTEGHRHCVNNKCIGDDTKAAAHQSLNCIKNKKIWKKRFSIWRMEFLHPAMWHDHDIDFVRWLHPAMWHVALESWQ